MVSDWHVWILLHILTVQKLWDFDFLRGLAPGLLNGFSIGRYENKRESFDPRTFLLRSLKVERWKNCSGAGALQNMDSSLVLLLLGTVNGELKTLQNRSRAAFEAKKKLGGGGAFGSQFGLKIRWGAGSPAPSLDRPLRFQTLMGKTYTRFQTKTVQNPLGGTLRD